MFICVCDVKFWRNMKNRKLIYRSSLIDVKLVVSFDSTYVFFVSCSVADSMNSDSYMDLQYSNGGGSNGSLNNHHHHHQRTKRMRTSFKHHQLRTMKTYFTLNHNPDAKDLKQLSQKTGLAKRVLQVSFSKLISLYFCFYVQNCDAPNPDR